MRQTADQVRRDLAGADEETFSRMAREISDDTPTASEGGDLGFISRKAAEESFPRGLVDSIFQLRQGEISPVLQSDLGYHIFMAVDDWLD